MVAKESGLFEQNYKKIRYSGHQTKVRIEYEYNYIAQYTARRTFITMVSDFLTPFEIMKITGHKKVQTVYKYSNVSTKHLRDKLINLN